MKTAEEEVYSYIENLITFIEDYDRKYSKNEKCKLISNINNDLVDFTFNVDIKDVLNHFGDISKKQAIEVVIYKLLTGTYNKDDLKFMILEILIMYYGWYKSSHKSAKTNIKIKIGE